MKTNKEDIRLLKLKHRLELVMQSCSVNFEVDAANSDLWYGKTAEGYTVTVNIKSQLYELSRPGMDTKAGDVFAWLQWRFNWSFAMAINYLKKREPDPKRETQPAKIEKIEKNISKNVLAGEWKIIHHSYTDPITGSYSCAWSYNEAVMNDAQKSAVEIAGDWTLKYFSLSSSEIYYELESMPHRFKQIIDFEIAKCDSCKTPFNWQVAGTLAYSCEERKHLDVISDDENAEYMRTDEEILIDADFVICDKCARSKYAPRYKALNLLWKSAYRQEEAERQESLKREREEAERKRTRLEAEGYVFNSYGAILYSPQKEYP